jgi:hypothetical protein
MINFDLVKGRIQRFSKNSLTSECLGLLAEMQRDNKKNYAFWNLLVLLKWILIHSIESVYLLKANRQDLVDTLIIIEKFESDQQVIDFKKGIIRGFRIIAYQQFWAQDVMSDYTFDSQLTLFAPLDKTSNIGKIFLAKTGIEIVEFIKLSYATYIYFNLHKANSSGTYTGRLDQDYFQITDNYFERQTVLNYLKLLTVNECDDLIGIQKMTTEIYQLYETSFWSLKPLLNFNNILLTPHRAVFEESSRHFIYNYLKRNSSEFSDEFGERMERYIELGLKETCVNYFKEVDLKAEYPHLTKVVDFLVNDNILVESKAIELHPRSGILRRQEILLNEFENSIIKSYKQILETANSIDQSRTWYGIVITYKETYIGFGNDAWEEFLKVPISEYVFEKGLKLEVVPPRNLCFIKLEDWDIVVQNVKNGKETFESIIKKAVDLNLANNFSQKILLFEQALRQFYPIKHIDLTYITNAHKLIDIP